MSIRATITGVGGFIPGVITNEEFIETFGRKAEIVDSKIPHKARYSALKLPEGEKVISNSDMGFYAAKDALQMSDTAPEELDMIIYASGTPDYPLPPCFTILQEKLGTGTCMGMDIRSGCSGFGTAMITATQYIESGAAEKVLVVGADLISSRSSHMFDKPEAFPLKGLFNLMLFGDAAGAVVIEKCDDHNGIFGWIMGSSKSNRDFGSIIEVGGSEVPYPSSGIKPEDWVIKQNGPLNDELIPQVLIEATAGFLNKFEMKITDFDYVVLPVESEKLLIHFLDHYPDLERRKIVSIGSEGGSLANAAVPLSILRGCRDNLFKRGDRILLYTSENTRWQHAALGMIWSL